MELSTDVFRSYIWQPLFLGIGPSKPINNSNVKLQLDTGIFVFILF